MAEESNTTSATDGTTIPASGNDPTARTTDGTIKDQSATQPITSPQSEPKTDGTDTPDTDPKPTAPEAYTFTAPEGQQLNQQFLDEATPIFKELGLDNAKAQKLVDTWNKLAKSESDLSVEAVNRMREGWRTEFTKSDLGSKVDDVKASVGRMKDAIFANDAVGRKAFEDAMDLTGAGDHPAVIAAWYKASQKFTEGTHVSGGKPSPLGQRAPGEAPKSAAQRMYPNLPSIDSAA